MKKQIAIILVGLCAVLGIVFFMYQDYKKEYAFQETEFSFQVGKEIIQTWHCDNVYYLFLPSYADRSDIRLTSFSPMFRVTEQELQLDITHNIDLQQIPMGQVLDCVFMESEDKFEFCIMQSEYIPSVFIDLQSGNLKEIQQDKEYRTGAKLVIRDSTGQILTDVAIKSMGGRGNTSFTGYEKKPFTLNLKEDASLLGLPLGDKYVLLSNASDPTLIRNDISRRMEEAIGLAYAHTGRFVDLYIDEQYQGNYYLCDKLEIGTQRIDITNIQEEMDLVYQHSNYEALETYETESMKAKKIEYVPQDITGGYLFEREYEDRYRLEYGTMGSGFQTNGGEYFVMHSPAYCSVEQIKYLSSYIDEIEQAILSKDGINKKTLKSYQEYINIDSFVKKYLVEEISKNYDGGVSSTFFYKDSDSKDGKLYAAPGWDYDMSWGNYVEWMEYFAENPKGISKLAVHTYSSPWYTHLYEKEEYLELVKKYYQEKIVPFMEEMLETGIDTLEEELKASTEMNHVRWSEELKSNYLYQSREESFEMLKTFMKERKDFLDEVWIEGQEYHTVTFWKNGYLSELTFVKDGEQLGELPKTVSQTQDSWKQNETGMMLDETLMINEDIRFDYVQNDSIR